MKKTLFIAVEFDPKTLKEDLDAVAEEVLDLFKLHGMGANAIGVTVANGKSVNFDFDIREVPSVSLSHALGELP